MQEGDSVEDFSLFSCLSDAHGIVCPLDPPFCHNNTDCGEDGDVMDMKGVLNCQESSHSPHFPTPHSQPKDPGGAGQTELVLTLQGGF